MITKIFPILLLLLCSILFLTSAKVIYLNIINFGETRDGEIIEVKFKSAELIDGFVGSNIHKILLANSKDTVYATPNVPHQVGDKVKMRFLGKSGNVIFNVNGESVGSKYGLWDWLSPLLFLFTGFLGFGLIKLILFE